MNSLRQQLIRDEGWENKAYPDPLSPAGKARAAGKSDLGLDGVPWTIGVGHTGPEVHQGSVWTDVQIDAVLTADMDKHNSQVTAEWPWSQSLDPARLAALQNMAFNLGIPRLSKFQKMLSALKNGAWLTAYDQARDSLWFKQVGARGERVSKQLLTGEWQ